MNWSKSITILIAALFVTVGADTPVSAEREAEEHNWEISGFGNVLFPEEDNLEDEPIYAGGRLMWVPEEHIGVGIESGWLSLEQENNNVHYGDNDGVPVFAEVMLKAPLEGTGDHVVPYLVGGVGAIFWEFEESNFLEEAGVDVDDEAAFAAKAGLGADFFITNNFAVFVEGGYMWSEYEAEIGASGPVLAANVETNAAYAGGGIKFAF